MAHLQRADEYLNMKVRANSGTNYEEDSQGPVLITQRGGSSNPETPRRPRTAVAPDPNSTERQQSVAKQYEPSETTNLVLLIIYDLITIALVFAIFIFVHYLLDPRLSYFTCDQSDVFYPYLTDTVPFWAVGVYGVASPIIIILIIEIVRAQVCSANKLSARQTFVSIYNFISLFVLGIGITLVITEIGKRWVGRLRPHFIAVCQPNVAQLNCSVSSSVTGFTYNSIYTGAFSFCQNTDSSAVEEARLSFPSGHASFSSYCMLYFIIYVEDRWMSIRLRYFKVMLQMAAFIAAYLTSVSRVSDYHHRGSDVVGGIVIGVIIAVFLTKEVGRKLFWFKDKEANK